jgi:hypothetical protein
MKRLFVSALLWASFTTYVDAAPTARPQIGGTPTHAVAASGAAAARAAVGRSAPVAVRAAAPVPAAAVGSVAARAAVGRSAPVAAVPKTVSARAAAPVTAARAAATQKVINAGTKVAVANANTVVNEECRQKYYGCMDSFCMLDNTSGGRCLCSNRNAELDTVLAEIESLDARSYKMATEGVERLEMGAEATEVIAQANAIASSIEANAEKKSPRRTLDLSMWDNVGFDFEEDVFATDNDPTEGKTGDALHTAVANLCVAQIPECSKDLSMLQMMYAQQVRSDCTAYENDLKRQKNASAGKLAAAEKALRDTALEQYRSANKWDLGQCAIEFKKCMSTTAGCKDDFTGCVGIAAAENAQSAVGRRAAMKMIDIKGAVTRISIAASTMEALESKKPLCESITNSCVRVKDQVWNVFLREVAPQVKSAELTAESDLRTNCIGNISACFQKACRDNIDPNNPDGSYDMCLTRPETMRSLCSVQIDPCEKAEPMIMKFVTARLAAMRVDSCTKQVKECLQSEDRCGSDYTQCVGLDTDTIVRMCPYDKLVGCQLEYSDPSKANVTGEGVHDKLADLIEGIMLSIDNNMLNLCQKAANDAMIKVCGDTENCDSLAVDDNAGTRSLKYEVCKYSTGTNGSIKWTNDCRTSLDAVAEKDLKLPEGQGWGGKLSGIIYWGEIGFDLETTENSDTGQNASASRTTDTGRRTTKFKFTTSDEYIEALNRAGQDVDADAKAVIRDRVFGMEVLAVQKSVERTMKIIESDPTLQFCITGRKVQGMKIADGENSRRDIDGTDYARFPELTNQMRYVVAMSALRNASKNYSKKYDEEITKMMQDQVKAAARIDKNDAIEAAKTACKDWATNSGLPVSKAPKANNAGKWVAMVAIAAAAVVGSIFTFGAAAAAGVTAITAIAATGAVGVAGAIGVATVAGSMSPVGQNKVDQWNFKQTINTLFSSSSGICTKVTVTQNCDKIKKNYCQKWAEPVEEKQEVNLM